MKKSSFIIAAILVFGFPTTFLLTRCLEKQQASQSIEFEEQELTFKAGTLKKYSVGSNGLIADYYWMSALQYLGQKIVKSDGLQNVQIDDLKSLDPRLLYPLLDAATTLDPDYTVAYSYGATILPAIDIEQAVQFSEKGVAAQPENWRMYHNLGYIHWKNNEFKRAAEVYAIGATKPNAPIWMNQMSANMQAQGGSRETARQIYQQLYENAQDDQTKEMAARRLLQVASFDERDAIRAEFKKFKNQNNRCAASWSEMFDLLRRTALIGGKPLRFAQSLEPLDPSGAPYKLDNQDGKCEIELDAQNSKVPLK